MERNCCSVWTEEDGGNYRFEYSPESFTGTEMDFALDICNGRTGRMETNGRAANHHQSAGYRLPLHAARICQPD